MSRAEEPDAGTFQGVLAVSARRVATGGRIVGRYQLGREIGSGAMATVYVARQLDLERRVALKELRALSMLDPLSARRFLHEARLAGSFGHPNIVTVHDYFEHDGVPYIAMEYHAPGSLRPYVGHLTVPQVLGVIEGLLAGLGHAHRHQVVHRDVKPENLLVTVDGGITIADFGIAKATHLLENRSLLTASGTTVGTPNYIAPEQAMARPLGPWTDLYSVGITAFELLTGRTPFGDTGEAMGIVLRQINEPVPWVSAVAPGVDPSISDWVSWLVSKSPVDRPQSAGEAWDALEEIVLGILGPRWRREALLLTPEASAAEMAEVAGPVYFSGVPQRASRSVTELLVAATVPPRRQAATGAAPVARRRGRPRVAIKLAAVAATAIALAAVALGRSDDLAPVDDGSGAAALAEPGSAVSAPPETTPESAADPTSDGTSDSTAGSTQGAAVGPGGVLGLEGKAARARALARTYERAAARIHARTQADPVDHADAALERALRRTGHSYRTAAAAAERGDLAAYTAAMDAAGAGQQDVAALIEAAEHAAGGASPPIGQQPGSVRSSGGDSSCAGDSRSDDPSDDECGE